MIRVTVDIIPFGIAENRRTLGFIDIVNDGTGDRYLGNYKVLLKKVNVEGDSAVNVKNYDRGKGWLHLLKKCVDKLCKQENVS